MFCELCYDDETGEFSCSSKVDAQVSVENVISLSHGFLCPSSLRALFLCRPCVERVQATGQILTLWKGKLDLVSPARSSMLYNGEGMVMDGHVHQASSNSTQFPSLKPSLSLDSGITFDSDSNGEFFEAEDVSRPSTAFASAEEDESGSPIRSRPNFSGETPFLSPAMSLGFPSHGFDSPPPAPSSRFASTVAPFSSVDDNNASAPVSSPMSDASAANLPFPGASTIGLPFSAYSSLVFSSSSSSAPFPASSVVNPRPPISPPLPPSASLTPPPNFYSLAPAPPPLPLLPPAVVTPPGFNRIASPLSSFRRNVSAPPSDGIASTAGSSPAFISPSLTSLFNPGMFAASLAAATQPPRNLSAPPVLTHLSPPPPPPPNHSHFSHKVLSSFSTQQLASFSAQQSLNRLPSSSPSPPSTYQMGQRNATGAKYSGSRTSLFSLKECRLGANTITPQLQPSTLLYGSSNNIQRPRPIQKSVAVLEVDMRLDDDSDEKMSTEFVDHSSALQLQLRPSFLASSRRGCGFCLSNGERQRECMSHRLKDPETNIVECPQLRKFVCPLCKATGDLAHTQGYCPMNECNIPTVKHLKKKRSSAGRLAGGKNYRPDGSIISSGSSGSSGFAGFGGDNGNGNGSSGFAGFGGDNGNGNGSLGVVDPSIIAIGPKGGRGN